MKIGNESSDKLNDVIRKDFKDKLFYDIHVSRQILWNVELDTWWYISDRTFHNIWVHIMKLNR